MSPPGAESTAVHPWSWKPSLFLSHNSISTCGHAPYQHCIAFSLDFSPSEGISLSSPWGTCAALSRPHSSSCLKGSASRRPLGVGPPSHGQTSSKRLGPDSGCRLGVELASCQLPAVQCFSNLSEHHLKSLLRQIAGSHP